MRTTYLRIGNLITQDSEIYSVCGISDCRVFGVTKEGIVDGKTIHLDIAGFEPIPLTEEILLKCGFEKKKDLNTPPNRANSFLYVKDNRIIFCGNYLGGEVCLQFRYGSYEIDMYNLIVLKYVHQPQNLWFVLTNTELNIEL